MDDFFIVITMNVLKQNKIRKKIGNIIIKRLDNSLITTIRFFYYYENLKIKLPLIK